MACVVVRRTVAVPPNVSSLFEVSLYARNGTQTRSLTVMREGYAIYSVTTESVTPGTVLALCIHLDAGSHKRLVALLGASNAVTVTRSDIRVHMRGFQARPQRPVSEDAIVQLAHEMMESMLRVEFSASQALLRRAK